MFHSKKYNLLFIASPKTGTESVQKLLAVIDPSGSMREVDLGARRVGPKDMPRGLIGHATANELKTAIGEKTWDQIETIVLIREPKRKLVSAYNYNRQSSLMEKVRFLLERKKVRDVSTLVSICAAKILPFSIWILFYRMKTNTAYCTDASGRVIVKHIGRTEFLASDLKKILEDLNIETKDLELPHINRSVHSDPNSYYQNRLVKLVFNSKYRVDEALYNEVSARF